MRSFMVLLFLSICMYGCSGPDISKQTFDALAAQDVQKLGDLISQIRPEHLLTEDELQHMKQITSTSNKPGIKSHDFKKDDKLYKRVRYYRYPTTKLKSPSLLKTVLFFDVESGERKFLVFFNFSKKNVDSNEIFCSGIEMRFPLERVVNKKVVEAYGLDLDRQIIEKSIAAARNAEALNKAIAENKIAIPAPPPVVTMSRDVKHPLDVATTSMGSYGNLGETYGFEDFKEGAVVINIYQDNDGKVTNKKVLQTEDDLKKEEDQRLKRKAEHSLTKLTFFKMFNMPLPKSSDK